MGKFTVDDFADLDKLYKLRIWCWVLSGVSFILSLLVFPHATRNPKAMANSAFSAFVEVAWMDWLILPMLILSAIFLVGGFVVTWRIKSNKVYKANENRSNVA